MAACRVCKKPQGKYERSPMPDVCVSCYDRGALPPPMEPLRPRVPCARCGGTLIVRGVVRSHDSVGELMFTRYQPIAAATTTGILESYICRRCGFTELYTRDAERIPIGLEHGTELIEIAGDSPYR